MRLLLILLLATSFQAFADDSSDANHDCTDGPDCGRSEREEASVNMVPSAALGGLVTPGQIAGTICVPATESYEVEANGEFRFETMVLRHAGTTKNENKATRNRKVQEWWRAAMPYIDCYGGSGNNGFEGGSPLNLLAYQGHQDVINRMMGEYELTPSDMLYPDPKTNMTLFEWMEARITGNGYASNSTKSRLRDAVKDFENFWNVMCNYAGRDEFCDIPLPESLLASAQ